MKRICIIVCMLIAISSVVFTDNVIGTVELAIGKITIIRGDKKIKPKRGMEIELYDKIDSQKNARFTLVLLDGNKIKVPTGKEVIVEDIVVKALSQRSSDALSSFMDLIKKLSKDKDYDSVMIATMGARGIGDEMSTKNTIKEIDNLLPVQEDISVILDLLLLKADLYLELGDYKKARDTYKELIDRDKKKVKSKEIKGLLVILDALENKHVRITPFKCENAGISQTLFDILQNDLSKSGMLQVSGKSGDTQSMSGAHYILTGKISLAGKDINIYANLNSAADGEVINTWTVSGSKENITFCSQQLAGLIHHSLTNKDIPNQNITQYLIEPEGIESLKEVDIYLGLNKDGIVPSYKIDEELIIHFKLNGEKNKKYYITIMSIGPDGEVNLLFPNSFNKKNEIPVNAPYSVPEENDLYHLTVYGNAGKNYIIGIVTEKPLTLADNEKIKQEVFPMLSANPEDYISKGLMVSATKSKITRWRIGVIHFMAVTE